MDAAALHNGFGSSRGLARREGNAPHRAPLLRSPLALVEDFASRGAPRAETRGFSPDFQVCFPYRGLFVYHVGADDVVSDANQVVFVSAGEPYRLTEPVAGGYAEVIVTLPPEQLAELAGTSSGGLRFHPLFRRRSRRADPRVQLLRARLLHASDGREPLASEELLVELLRSALVADATSHRASPATRCLIRRAKEFVEAHATEPIHLADVAGAAGASPAYLTDLFRRCEGLSLHRYAVQLRLARALVELPHAADLTTLALDLGFSSHSHFTAAFRRAFGCTPSEFRESTRPRVAASYRTTLRNSGSPRPIAVTGSSPARAGAVSRAPQRAAAWASSAERSPRARSPARPAPQ